MKANTLFNFGVPQQEQPLVQAEPLPQVQPNLIQVEPTQVPPNTFATINLGGQVVVNDMVDNTAGQIGMPFVMPKAPAYGTTL